MPPTPSEGAAQMATARDLDRWLPQIGLEPDAKFGPWELTGAEIVCADTERGIRLTFADRRAPTRVIRIRLLARDPKRPAFARTASLDFLYENVPDALRATAAKLLLVVHAVVAPRDRGGILPPLPAADMRDNAGAARSAGGTHRPPGTNDQRDRPLVEGSAGAGFPTPYHRFHLEQTIDLPADVRAAFRRDGHVLIRGALDRGVVLAAREVVVAALAEAIKDVWVPMAERTDAYSRSFTQITHLGLQDEAIRTLAQSRRLAKMAADLIGVRGIRIFCEDWLIKEPGADITPWHQDSAVMPFHTEATITIWIPFQPVTKSSGLLRFARDSYRGGIQPVENISDVSQAEFEEIIRTHGWPVDDSPPLLVGDVSFHEGSTIHGAFPNHSAESRYVLSLACFADGATLKEPTTEAMRHIRDLWAGDAAVGEPAASRFWPLTYGGEASAPEVGHVAESSPAGHLQAILLPAGRAPVDLWVQDGRIRFTPVAGAQELAAEVGFLTSGLVDCHTHLSWPHTPAMEQQAQSPAFMNANRAEFTRLGVLALRDMGSASDRVAVLADVPGLARVHAAGMVVVPYGNFPFTPTAPETLEQTCVERLQLGATWVKIFTDWSSDWRGQVHTGFGGDNAVTYPLAVLRAAVTAVHELGGRVAAHCFTRAGAAVAVEAGVDSLEHGWGVDRALIEDMAARAVAWIPLLSIGSVMWRDAVRAQPVQASHVEWIEQSMATLADTLPYAHSRGVAVLAGTDWFPEVTVLDEIRELAALGLEPAAALAAGAWVARQWLGEPGLEEGAPADLVLYRDDPRLHLDTLDAPLLILSGGERVASTPIGERRRHTLFSQRRDDEPL